MSTTPNMNLLLPIPTITPGPTYASEEVAAFTTIDAHDHTSGKGVPVPTLGININADLPFNGYNATIIRSSIYQSQSAVLSLPTDICSIYVVNGNLFYNNNLGQPVQITSGAAIDATSIGGIGGDYATSTALVFYTSADRTFTFWSNTNVPANIDAGSVTIRPIATSPDGITLSAPSGLATNYTMTLPAALPTATSLLTEDTSGNIGYSTGGLNPPGSIIMFGGVAAPTGYLLCDGTSYLKATYPLLSATLFDSGTGLYAYGSADATHFNVPDFRGIFPRGVDAGANNDPDSSARVAANPNGNAGDNVGSYQADATGTHTHFRNPSQVSEDALIGGSAFGIPAGANFTLPGITSTGPVSSGNSSTENRSKNLYVQFIIKI